MKRAYCPRKWRQATGSVKKWEKASLIHAFPWPVLTSPDLRRQVSLKTTWPSWSRKMASTRSWSNPLLSMALLRLQRMVLSGHRNWKGHHTYRPPKRQELGLGTRPKLHHQEKLPGSFLWRFFRSNSRCTQTAYPQPFAAEICPRPPPPKSLTLLCTCSQQLQHTGKKKWTNIFSRHGELSSYVN